MNDLKRSGFTFIELLMVVALVVALGLISIVNFSRERPNRDLGSAKLRIVAVLREASTRSIGESEGKTWGVHFEVASATSSFYTVFSETYSVGTSIEFSALPRTLRFDTSTWGGQSKDISFEKITGKTNASTSVRIYIAGDVAKSSTIAVSSSGLVTF